MHFLGHSSARMIIVSNRLPVSISTSAGERKLVPSSGGLATALSEVHEKGSGHWVGWLGETSKLSVEALARLTEQAALSGSSAST